MKYILPAVESDKRAVRAEEAENACGQKLKISLSWTFQPLGPSLVLLTDGIYDRLVWSESM